ncbi:MAG: EAL domain-containing protein [Gammaproteobacteria bacterium]|nr:EAL domain-containing protein [Gammaproteobacteria bacterium]
MDCTEDLVLLLDDRGHITWANTRAVATYGYPRDALLGLTIHDLDPDFPAETWAQHWASLKRCGKLNVSVRHLCANGVALPVEISDTWLEFEGAEYSIVIARDLSQRADSDERAQLTRFSIDHIDESVFWIGPDARILYANDAACRNLGYASDELVGMPVTTLDPNFPTEIWPLHWEELKQRKRIQFETHHRHRDGKVFPVEVTANFLQIGEREFNCAFVRDITARRKTEGQLRQMATHDQQTGLPNRALLIDRVERALAHAKRHDSCLGVLFVNIDRMQQVNLDHGHAIGDQVITSVAQRLKAALRGIDTLAHWGGDTFVVLVTELAEPEYAGDVAQKLLDALNVPLDVEGRSLTLSASIGIALYPEDGHDTATLIKNADISMFRAKEYGGGTSHFFSADLKPGTAERIRTLLDLRRALGNDELLLLYQPAIDLESGLPVALEALVRWAREPGELLLPETFLNTAEETGFILELGAHVLDLACVQLAAWRAEGIAAPAITWNVSPRQLRDKEFVSLVASTLQRHALAPSDLQLDLPPRLLTACSPAVTAVLEQLANLGVALGIDDVGHAPADFALLQKLPLAVVKLDTRLVERTADDPAAAKLAGALAGAAHHLGTRVLAEGVVNDTLLECVRTLGCDQAQGEALAAPMDAVACTEWLVAHAAG